MYRYPQSHYICGDINIDLLQQNAKPEVKYYSDNLFSLGCIPLINTQQE